MSLCTWCNVINTCSKESYPIEQISISNIAIWRKFLNSCCQNGLQNGISCKWPQTTQSVGMECFLETGKTMERFPTFHLCESEVILHHLFDHLYLCLWILGLISRRGGGGPTRLPKFKFSAKFPIGLHVILQIQIRKFENDCYIMWKIISTENPSRFNVEPLLK